MYSTFRGAVLGLLTLATLATAADAAAPRPFPTSGPRFNTSGNLNWNQFRGKTVVVDFWNHH